jgi:hypothetical protein
MKYNFYEKIFAPELAEIHDKLVKADCKFAYTRSCSLIHNKFKISGDLVVVLEYRTNIKEKTVKHRYSFPISIDLPLTSIIDPDASFIIKDRLDVKHLTPGIVEIDGEFILCGVDESQTESEFSVGNEENTQS